MFKEFPKWIADEGSTPEKPTGKVVNSKAEEEALLKKRGKLEEPEKPGFIDRLIGTADQESGDSDPFTGRVGSDEEE